MPSLSCALLVDDDQTVNYLNTLLLSRMNVAENILVALNGQEALDLLRAHFSSATLTAPALILLDIKMPVMDGFAFLEAFEELALTNREAIIIVMLTTSLHPQDLDRVQRHNIAGFLNKPLTRDKLTDILDRHFSRSSRAH